MIACGILMTIALILAIIVLFDFSKDRKSLLLSIEVLILWIVILLLLNI